MPQYAKRLTLHKGVDNQIQFQFLNQEQKPVDITDLDITLRIISSEGNELLLSISLDDYFPKTGLATLTIRSQDIENIPAQLCFYSLEIPRGNLSLPVFVDYNAGGRGELSIVDSILPSFEESVPVTIATGQPFPNIDPEIVLPIPNANVYYTSVLNNTGSVLTISAQYEEYNGQVKVQGSTEVDRDWYDIVTEDYANVTDTFGYTVKGFHPFVRLEFTSDGGNVTKVLAR